MTRKLDDNFNIKNYLGKNKKVIADRLLKMINEGKTVRSVELALRTLGELIEKKEEVHKVEFTVTDRQQIATEFLEGLRREAKDSGICPVCDKSKALRLEPCLDTEPEHETDREVAVLELPTGFV